MGSAVSYLFIRSMGAIKSKEAPRNPNSLSQLVWFKKEENVCLSKDIFLMLTFCKHFFLTAINITYPSFSGTDAFGYTSFLAYSAIPNISLCYEFHLKFQLANHNSSLQDNLIFFTGQKGQGKDLEFVSL